MKILKYAVAPLAAFVFSSFFVTNASAGCAGKENWEPYFNFKVEVKKNHRTIWLSDEYDDVIYTREGHHIYFKEREDNIVKFTHVTVDRQGRHEYVHGITRELTVCIDEYDVVRVDDSVIHTETQHFFDFPDGRN